MKNHLFCGFQVDLICKAIQGGRAMVNIPNRDAEDDLSDVEVFHSQQKHTIFCQKLVFIGFGHVLGAGG